MFDLNATLVAVERLKSVNQNNTLSTTDALEKPPALAFCCDSIIFNFAKEVSQCLSEYHIWKQKSSRERNQLIERIAEERGMKATTIKSHIKVSGPLVSEILQWLGQDLWAIVILLLLYIRKSLDSQGPAIGYSILVGNFKDLNLQEKIAKLAELIPDPKQYWDNDNLKSDNVLWVLEIACSRKPPFRDRGRQHQRSPRRRAFQSPQTRSLQELKLPSLLRERSNSWSPSSQEEARKLSACRTRRSSPMLFLPLLKTQRVLESTEDAPEVKKERHSSSTPDTDIRSLYELETTDED